MSSINCQGTKLSVRAVAYLPSEHRLGLMVQSVYTKGSLGILGRWRAQRIRIIARIVKEPWNAASINNWNVPVPCRREASLMKGDNELPMNTTPQNGAKPSVLPVDGVRETPPASQSLTYVLNSTVFCLAAVGGCHRGNINDREEQVCRSV